MAKSNQNLNEQDAWQDPMQPDLPTTRTQWGALVGIQFVNAAEGAQKAKDHQKEEKGMEKGQTTNDKSVPTMAKEKQEAAMKVQTRKKWKTHELATGH